MASRVCLVHYHEIGLKGKNRARFERILMDNLKAALAAFSVAAINRISGHILVSFSQAGQAEEACALIARVPGVARVSLAFHTGRVADEYCDAAVHALTEFGPFESFKVHARRSNTDYELSSLDLNRQVGEVLCAAFPEKRVQMHGPDAIVYVLVVQGSVYVYARSMRGVGGLPQGSAGKVMTLLSSGIDSPVATWMMARRGAVPVPVHFSGRPQTPDTSEYLVQDIVAALAPEVQVGRLYVVPFGDVQREIAIACPSGLRVIMYRRIMYAVTERLGRIEGAKAIVTGESLGQVASQTLENIMAVNEVVDLPVFRPLIGSDKQEIIERAEQIGTYEISTQTAPDCCTLFMPRRPETHARLAEVHEAWELIDHEGMIEGLVAAAEYVDFTAPTYRPPRKIRARHEALAPRAADPLPEAPAN
ncbi:MAG: tRNA 4-thiouridine(8) synthase ThiI [Coriobacteriaceae bacterium]|nr:tRNA 4-thiouridine(8) synthase ThiI [Coriobacteriaceae bacterium]